MNRQIFLDAFTVCTQETHQRKTSISMEEDDTAAVKPTGQMSPKLSRILALLMIELVSPDVMYNGIPWPEEEFMKVTIERCVLCGRCREVCVSYGRYREGCIVWSL